jgi:hypothetical protein
MRLVHTIAKALLFERADQKETEAKQTYVGLSRIMTDI